MTAFNKLCQRLKNQQYTWLVTGVAGFIGSNLLEFLLSHGQKVVGLDNFATGHRHNLDAVARAVGADAATNFHFIEGDITCMADCQAACEGVDVILHQAALGSVPRSIADPISTNQANLDGFLNMLTAAKEADIKRFVYASSSSVYGDSEELPKVEARTGQLLSPYAVTKMANELYAGVFAGNYGMQTIGLRYFNVFGRRQDPQGAYAAVIPKWISALLSAEAVYINGDGETSRDFTYIDNVVQMNVLAAMTSNEAAYGQAVNVAVGGRNTLNELYAIINAELSGCVADFSAKPPEYRDFRAGDIRHSNADISKAEALFGYVPTHDIFQGMQAAIEWYVENNGANGDGT